MHAPGSLVLFAFHPFRPPARPPSFSFLPLPAPPLTSLPSPLLCVFGCNGSLLKRNVSATIAPLQVRDLWEEYYTGADAIVFMVDSSDHERFEEVCFLCLERMFSRDAWTVSMVRGLVVHGCLEVRKRREKADKRVCVCEREYVYVCVCACVHACVCVCARTCLCRRRRKYSSCLLQKI